MQIKTKNKGGAVADALVVIAIVVVLFFAWVAFGGPEKDLTDPNPGGFPTLNIIETYDETGSSSISENTNVATTSDYSENPYMGGIALVLGVFIIIAAYVSVKSGGGDKKK
jgi:hypothetical protein